MYCIKTEHSFDAAHFLYGYEGKCSNIHGHRWRVVISVCREQLEQKGSIQGMLVDFSDLKQDIKDLVYYFDHTLIIEKGTLKDKTYEALCEEGFQIISLPFRPTAENLAKYFYEKMEGKGYQVQSAMVYETPNNCAEYFK